MTSKEFFDKLGFFTTAGFNELKLIQLSMDVPTHRPIYADLEIAIF
jgi:hypothetical protein